MLTFHVTKEAARNLRVSEKGEKVALTSISIKRRVLTKTEYDTYNPTLNRFLREQRIRRKDATMLSDQKDTIAFEWMSVDL